MPAAGLPCTSSAILCFFSGGASVASVQKVVQGLWFTAAFTGALWPRRVDTAKQGSQRLL